MSVESGLEDLDEIVLTPVQVLIDQVYLDPNNPRFHRERNVSDERIDESSIQNRARERMSSEGIRELKESIKLNGFLPIDRIVLREFKENKYVVVEGNRRLTAVKELLEEHEAGEITLSERKLKSLGEFEALVYEGDDPREISWSIQGIRHLSGIKDWGAWEKAKYLTRLVGESGKNFTEAGKAFGMSSHRVGDYVRGYHAFNQMKGDEEFGEFMEPSKFSYAAELFSRKNIPLRDNWLEWSDDQMQFENEENLRIFLDLITSTDDDPARITRAIDIRDLSDIKAEDDSAFERFLTGESIESVKTWIQKKKAEEKVEKELTLEDYLEDIRELRERIKRLPIGDVFENRETVVSELESVVGRCNSMLKNLKKG